MTQHDITSHHMVNQRKTIEIKMSKGPNRDEARDLSIMQAGTFCATNPVYYTFSVCT